MIRAALLAWLIAMVAGCGPKIDRGQCLQSETSIVPIAQYMTICTNGICRQEFTHFLMLPVTSCEAWEFPEGRPQGVESE